jgi:hypothetical protein
LYVYFLEVMAGYHLKEEEEKGHENNANITWNIGL